MIPPAPKYMHDRVPPENQSDLRNMHYTCFDQTLAMETGQYSSQKRFLLEIFGQTYFFKHVDVALQFSFRNSWKNRPQSNTNEYNETMRLPGISHCVIPQLIQSQCYFSTNDVIFRYNVYLDLDLVSILREAIDCKGVLSRSAKRRDLNLGHSAELLTSTEHT